MNAADELGYIKARIAELKKKEAKLKADIVANGERLEGELFDAIPVFSERSSIDWKAIALSFEPSRQKIAGNTKVSAVVSVRVVAKPEAPKVAA